MKTKTDSLFNQKFLNKIAADHQPSERQKSLINEWADTINSGVINTKKESELRGPFIRRFFVEILGYKPFGSGTDWTITEELRVGKGAADIALGRFSQDESTPTAPVELKGPDTKSLEAIMPGRHKSPVQQVWEYAMDIPNCEFMIVSNMIEFRLYSYAGTRKEFESFKITELASNDALLNKFLLLLSAENLLSGRTLELLMRSSEAQKEITEKLYSDYKTWRVQLLLHLKERTSKPLENLIEPVQKILDRILFIAFAEDRGLLPERTLLKAFQHTNPYSPQPIWSNFLGLFSSIDKGNKALGIPAYNGGLFAVDEEIDSLDLDDSFCHVFQEIGNYDFADDVSVSVLGHIFEQSVSDLEKLKEISASEDLEEESIASLINEQKGAVSGKRKRDGVVYTPDAITHYITNKTLGHYIENRRNLILESYTKGDGDWRSPTKSERELSRKRKNAKIKDSKRLVEFLFWSEWRDELSKIKVIDPACGSGAFLVSAFDLLDTEYFQANDQIQSITGNPDLFDINREILNSNLYGVDKNPESIEISKLSLWLKTAAHGKPLESLEASLLVGDSLVDSEKYAKQPFVWKDRFNDVFKSGGFDVVLGNPPYVRMELLTKIKTYLQSEYAVSSDRADAYCYFYELGLRLLKKGGTLGYISSSSFFKSRSGNQLRQLIANSTTINEIVDFTDVQVFEGVTTYTCIMVLSNSATESKESNFRYTKISDHIPLDLNKYTEENYQLICQTELKNHEAWRFSSQEEKSVWEKVKACSGTIKSEFGPPKYGIKSGCDKAFVLGDEEIGKILKEDPNSSDLLVPYIEGKHIKRWSVTPSNKWLIYTPKGHIDIDRYPSVRSFMEEHFEKLTSRATKQEWYELQQAQYNYSECFSRNKIVYPDIADRPSFAMDDGSFPATTGFCIDSEEFWVLGLLNSKLYWWMIERSSTLARGGYRRLKSNVMSGMPVPSPSNEVKASIGENSRLAFDKASQREKIHGRFINRVMKDLLSPEKKLTKKLNAWWELSFSEFHNEVKARSKSPIPLSERDDWEAYFTASKSEVITLNAEIRKLENCIDQLVFDLFGLTNSETQVINEH